MADYWKSQAKKFCEFCKCWIADNKPSIEFHEKGKRHRENVATRLKGISRQSLKEHKAKQKMEEDIKKMEKAGLEAYLKDVETNSDYTSRILNEQLNAANKSGNTSSLADHQSKETKKSESKVTVKVWYEAVSDEGYTYYWNTETGESVWEPPEDGHISLDEQKKLEEQELRRHTQKQNEEKRRKEEQEKEKAEECRAFLEREKMKSKAKIEKTETKSNVCVGPAPKGNPYGQWTTVKICEQKPVDLQLPDQKNKEFKIQVPTTNEPQVKFKEKNFDIFESEASSDINFKKRKMNSSTKRNMRQRLNDD